MEVAKPTPSGIAIKWALFNFATAIIVSYAIQAFGGNPFGVTKYLKVIPLIIFLILAQVEYRKQLLGYLSFGEGFIEGLLFSVFSAALIAIFTYVYAAVLSPQLWQQFVDETTADLIQQHASSDTIDTAVTMMTKYGSIFATAGALFGISFIGAIISLITAAIFKKERTLADIERQASESQQ